MWRKRTGYGMHFMNKERFSFLCSLYFPFFPPPSYLFVVIHKLLQMRDPEGSLLINLSFAMCAPPKKTMKVRYREHELIWGGFSGFILIDSEKIEVFFFNFHLCPRDDITLILKRGSNQSAVAGVPKKWENELNKSHFESSRQYSMARNIVLLAWMCSNLLKII